MTDMMINRNTSGSPESEMEMKVCEAVFSILNLEYPNHPWCIAVDIVAGTIVIDLLYKKPYKYQKFAYLLHLSSLVQDGNVQKVKRAGGELLERFGIPRDAASPEAQMKILTGQLQFDGSNADA